MSNVRWQRGLLRACSGLLLACLAVGGRLKPVLKAVGAWLLVALVLGSVATFFDTGPGHAWVQDFHAWGQHLRDHPDALRVAVKAAWDGVSNHWLEFIVIVLLYNLNTDVRALAQRFRDHDQIVQELRKIREALE